MSGFSDYEWEREPKQCVESSEDDDDTDDDQRERDEKMALRQRFAGGANMGMKGASRTCLRSLAIPFMIPLGICGISLFTRGIFYPVGCW